MKFVVCHGEARQDVLSDALGSIRRPFLVVTMDPLWWVPATENRYPRAWFNSKLSLMRFVLGRNTICLLARDKTGETTSMGASMHAMNVPIWEVR